MTDFLDPPQPVKEKKLQATIDATYEGMKKVLGVDIRDQSRLNMHGLDKELGLLSPQEVRLIELVDSMDFVMEHRTTEFDKIRTAGKLRSYEELKEAGKLDDEASATLEEDSTRWGNTDFVFFHLTPRVDGMTAIKEHGRVSTLRFRPEILYKAGWISPESWHSYHDGSKSIGYYGGVRREVVFTHTNKTYNYTDSEGKTQSLVKSPTQEAFYNGDILPALAKILIREARFINGDFQEGLLRVDSTEALEKIKSAFEKLFSVVEAKIPRELSLDLLI